MRSANLAFQMTMGALYVGAQFAELGRVRMPQADEPKTTFHTWARSDSTGPKPPSMAQTCHAASHADDQHNSRNPYNLSGRAHTCHRRRTTSLMCLCACLCGATMDAGALAISPTARGSACAPASSSLSRLGSLRGGFRRGCRRGRIRLGRRLSFSSRASSPGRGAPRGSRWCP